MAQGFQVGPKVGLNLAKVSDGEEVAEGSSEPFLTGFNIGAAFSIPVNEMFSIAPEISFSQKGRKATGEDSGVEMSVSQISNYIDVPVLVRASFGEGVRAYVNAGPAFNYWTGGKLKVKATFEGETEKETYKIVFLEEGEEEKEDEAGIDNANRLEVAAAIGGGVMFNAGAGDLLVDLRYNAGLNSFVDFGEEEGKAKNNVLSLSVIYLFRL